MMTFTYILLWVLIVYNAIVIILNHKLRKNFKELKQTAVRRQESADDLYESALRALKDYRPKSRAYNQILDAAEERYRIGLTGEVLISDLDKEFYAQVDQILINTQGEI